MDYGRGMNLLFNSFTSFSRYSMHSSILVELHELVVPAARWTVSNYNSMRIY